MIALKMVILFCPLSSFLFCTASEGIKETKAKSGEDVTLQCQGPRDAAFKMFKWIRPDLKSEGYVFFSREGRIYENYHHELFHDRVELKDPKMKNGNLSVILKNVSIRDTGTYECYAGITESSPLLISNITLTVEDSGDAAGDAAGHTDGGESMDSSDWQLLWHVLLFLLCFLMLL